MGERAVFRYEVPVDDNWHTITLSGPMVHVAAREPDVVEFWAIAGEETPKEYTFQVFGTGHPLPERINHVASAITPGGHFVWHLFERQDGAS